MAKQNRCRTFQIKRNDNLSVPIGNLVWAQAFKTKGTDLAKLTEAMVAYKAGDNFSILRCHEFTMQRPIREIFGLLLEKGTTSSKGFFCLVSDLDMDPREARSKYLSNDVVEKLFSSMKSDISIRSIRT